MDEAAAQRQAPPEAATRSGDGGLYEDDMLPLPFLTRPYNKTKIIILLRLHQTTPRNPCNHDDHWEPLLSLYYCLHPTRPFNPRQELWRVTFGTFHSICAKILRWNIHELVQAPSSLNIPRLSCHSLCQQSAGFGRFDFLGPRTLAGIRSDPTPHAATMVTCLGR